MARNGVQYARTGVKRCPMQDDACAKRVAEQIAVFYPQASGECDCGYAARITAAFYSISRVVVTHADGCASKMMIPFNAVALIEEKCGRFTRGAHAGKLRGWAEIEVAVEGGWKKYGPGERNGRVVRPGTVMSIRIVDFNGRPYLEVKR